MDSLFTIDSKIQELIEKGFTESVIDEETGEIDEQKLSSYFDQLVIDRTAKIDNMVSFIQNLDAEAKNIREQEKIFAERRKAKEATIERLENYIKSSMLINNELKFESPLHAVFFRKSQSIVIAPDAVIPDVFIRRKVTEEPDKTALKNALKNGERINGVELQDNLNLQIK